MAVASAVRDSLRAIADRASEGLSEREVENLFLERGFYDALGYEGTGTDLRSEFRLPDDRRPDVIALDANGAVTAVCEFEATGCDLPAHEDRLFRYMDGLRAGYGVLTDGKRLRLYRRGDDRPLVAVSTGAVAKSEAQDVADALRKRAFDPADSADLDRALETVEPVPLGEGAELGREHFFDTFRLEEGSPFADLVVGLADLLSELRDEREATFVEGAYDFWEATRAGDPDEIPDSWGPFVDGTRSLRDFMFCLESGHALLARLLLAKATEDHDLFAGTGYDGVAGYVRGAQGFGDAVDLEAFPVAADALVDDLGTRLVDGLFRDDVFAWWADAFPDPSSSGADSGRAVPDRREDAATAGVDEATRERFSRAVATVFVTVLRFDFARVEGDVLGDLYRRYFDPETRKALGEFYTPQRVVDYIMDGVGYDRGVTNERLVDPSCGSGTFLVEAVERYVADVKRREDDPDWEMHLRELCTRPRVVGLDVHPFAVLMARIRFVVAILPAYREAKRRNPAFTLRRLPVYRTDTLRNERELTGVDVGNDGTRQPTLATTEDERDVRIPVSLPLEADEDEAPETEHGLLVRRVRMPRFDTVDLETGVSDVGEYFAALQGVVDAVEARVARSDASDDPGRADGRGLEERIHRYTSREYADAAEFFEPYVEEMLETVRSLEGDDGRLFERFEDAVLAPVVKNSLRYDYVVGNPPYVRIQRISGAQREYVERLYESADGSYDLYYPFYERGIELLSEGGRLGYITPSQFTTAEDGEALRRLLRTETDVLEVFDFRGAAVFEDALTYPAIVVLERRGDRGERDDEIRCIRVRADYGDPPDDLGTRVIAAAVEHRRERRYADANVDVFRFPRSELTDDAWTLMPPAEYEVFQTLERRAEGTVREITDAVFQGLRTGANDVFVLEPLSVDRIAPEDAGGVVTVRSAGSERTFEVESDLLCPWLERDAFRRWQADWDGKHLLCPYGPDDELLAAETLAEEYPLTWEYLLAHRETLERREGGDLRGADDWYRLARPQNLSRFPRPKLIGKEFSDSARFVADDGDWHFASGYGVALADEYESEIDAVAGFLNSAVADYYLKHVASIKSFSPVEAYYAYRSGSITGIPYRAGDGAVAATVRRIRETLEADARTDRFPEAYVGAADGGLEYVTHEWRTRRRPVDADVCEDGGEFTVRAGRTDEIDDPAMSADDREARRRRAEYVRAAVDGRDVDRGEETVVPIPRADAGVAALLDRLAADREAVRRTDLEDLEAEIDEAVYDRFGLTEDQREVVSNYLEVF